MINSRKLFDDSEKAHPITEDEMIKIEKSMEFSIVNCAKMMCCRII